MYHPWNRAIVVGMTQTGKTTFVRDYLLNFIPNYIIYDPDLHFTNKGVVVADVEKLIQLVNKGYTRIVYQPPAEEIKNYKLRVASFEEICRFINYNLSNFVFVIDEIGVITKEPGKRQPRAPGEFLYMVMRRMKEPFRIGILTTTQRLKDSDVDFISQSQHLFIFKSHKMDYKYIEDKVDIDLKKEIRKLKPYWYLHYDAIEDTLTLHKPIPVHNVDKMRNVFEKIRKRKWTW